MRATANLKTKLNQLESTLTKVYQNKEVHPLYNEHLQKSSWGGIGLFFSPRKMTRRQNKGS
jgi:hypothetical protein